MASALRASLLFLVSAALLSGAAAQQINIPVTVQCLNLLDNNQIANIPGLNVGVIQVIAAALGGPGQAPSALFFNSECSESARKELWMKSLDKRECGSLPADACGWCS